MILVACRDREPAHEVPAPGGSDPCGASPTVIVTAMRSELDPLLARTTVVVRGSHDGYRFTCGTFAGRDAALVEIGIGPARSERGARAALARFGGNALVMVGIAGAVDRELRIGDVTIPAKWSRHDEEPRWLATDAALLGRARDAGRADLDACELRELCRPTKLVVGGNGVTGRRFVDDPAVGEDLVKRLGASVTDMETATVAQVALERRVPFIAVRAVSDLVWTGRSEELVEQFDALAAGNAAAVAEQLLRAP